MAYDINAFYWYVNPFNMFKPYDPESIAEDNPNISNSITAIEDKSLFDKIIDEKTQKTLLIALGIVAAIYVLKVFKK